MCRSVFIMILFALMVTSIVSAAPVQVDLSQDGDVQAGWIDWNTGGDKLGNDDISRQFVNEADFDGDFTIGFIKIDSRNRGDVDVSIPLHDVLDDALKESDAFDMVIKGLDAGEYKLTTYHHDPKEDEENDDGTLNITVTDADGTRLVADHLQQSWGQLPAFVGIASFTIKSDGSDIVITFEDNDDGNHNEAYLNGFELDVAAAMPTILVEAGGDIAAANAIAADGDIIGIAAGTFAITEALEIKDGVTYLGAGSGQTIIDCGGVTRAFVGWGDRSQNDGLPYSEEGYPVNTSGPKGWIIQGLSIINGVADDVDKSVLRVGDPAIDPPLTENVITDPAKSTNGGAICLENYAEGTLIDVAFDNCNALATGVDAVDPNATTYLGFGGALFMGSATANVVDCSFTNNNASNDGGAIHASNPEPENWDLTIENSTFTGNRCRDDGGSISAIRRNLSVINCVVEDSKTGLDPNTLADNVSGDPDGGFLWISGADKVEGTSYAADTPALEMLSYGGVINIVGSTFNNCGSRRGGAIRSNSAAQFNVTDSVFTNCTTTDNDGGAIYANSPTPFNPAVVDVNDPAVGEPGVFIEGVIIDGCIAGDDGGGIAVDNFSTTNSANYIEFPKVVINNCIVTNCRAGATVPDAEGRDGGGIYVNNQLNLTITNTVVENCTAGRHGAGIMVDGVCDSVLIDSVRVSNCSNDDISDEGGDGVALDMDQDETAVVIVTNCIFDNNINMQDDAVIRIDGDFINVANCTIVGNVTMDKGILYFGTGRDDPAVVTNKAINNLFVNNDSAPGSDNTINWNKDNNNNIVLNNIFFGTILDGDSEVEDTADADLETTDNFIASADPLVDTAGGDYHLAAGSEAINSGTAEDAPDHDIEGTPRPQGVAHDVGAYESPAN